MLLVFCNVSSPQTMCSQKTELLCSCQGLFSLCSHTSNITHLRKDKKINCFIIRIDPEVCLGLMLKLGILHITDEKPFLSSPPSFAQIIYGWAEQAVGSASRTACVVKWGEHSNSACQYAAEQQHKAVCFQRVLVQTKPRRKRRCRE